MSKQPTMEFDIGDWRKDPNVSMCSSATRGIWFDMLCAMHELEKCGQLTGNYVQLGRIARCSADEARLAILELLNTKTADVLLCNGNVTEAKNCISDAYTVLCNADCNAVVTVINRRMKRAFDERISGNIRVSAHRGGKLKQESNASSNGDVTSTSPHSAYCINTGINFNIQEQLFNNISTAQKEIWKKAYPAVDIEGNILRAAQWLANNPTKLKKNYGRFLTMWFSRTQERGGDNGRPKQTQRTPISQNDYSSGGSIPVYET